MTVLRHLFSWRSVRFRWRRLLLSAAAVPLVIAGLAVAPAAAGLSYSVTGTVAVGSNPFGVGADPSTDLVYVANEGANTVSVIDGTTNTVTATVAVGNGPDGVGVDPSTDTIYVADGGGGVSVIDGATNTVTATIGVGLFPQAVAVDPVTDTVYVTNSSSGTLSVIDGATNTVTATVGGLDTPLGVAVNPSTDTVYAADSDSGSVTVIDGATNTVTKTIAITSFFVAAVAVNPSTDTVYAVNANNNTVAVIDGATNTVTATIGVGTQLLFGFGIGVDPSADTVYVANNQDNTVSVIDGATNTVTATIGVGSEPVGVGVDPSTHVAYVANANGNTVSVISPATAATPALSTTPTAASVTLGATTPTLGDTAALSGGNAPTGMITFTLHHDGGSTPVDTETATVNGNGTYSTPVGYALPATGAVTGTYQWDAAYSGDANNNAVSDSNDTAEQVTVNAASPSLATTPAPASASFGTAATLTDTASLAGGYRPGGTITFTLTGPGGTTIDTETATVSGNGSYTTPAGYPLPVANSGTVAGSYQWDAVYSGDANNIESSDVGAANERAAVSPAATALSYTGPDQVAVKSSFTATGTLTSPAASCASGQPVNLSVSPDPLNTAVSSLSLGTPDSTASGAVSLAVSATGWADGVYTVTASYAGTANCLASSSTASVAVTVPGQLAFGAGRYTVPAAGPTSFAFAVAHGPRSTYLGGMTVVTPGKWWFRANVNSFGLTSATRALLAGAGSLYAWNPAVSRGHGGWQLVKSGVTFQATANAAAKQAAASFGITINDTPASGLPNSAPIALSQGRIVIA